MDYGTIAPQLANSAKPYFLVAAEGRLLGPAGLELGLAKGGSCRSLFPSAEPILSNYPRREPASSRRKSPIVAAFLSLLICRLGQAYNGQYLKGMAFFVGSIVVTFLTFGLLGLVAIVLAMVNAMNIAGKINQGQTVGPWQL